MSRKKPAIFVYPDLKTMGEIFAKFFLIRIEEIKKRNLENKRTVVALGGGRSIAELFNNINNFVSIERIKKVMSECDLWWSDERYIEKNSTLRNENSLQNFINLIDKSSNYFPMPSLSDQEIENDVKKLNENFDKLYSNKKEVFDIVILGAGEDGHVASLFPDKVYQNTKTFLPIIDSPKPPAKRISLSIEAIRSAKEVWVITSGKEKAEVITKAFKHLEENQESLSPEIQIKDMNLPLSKAIGTYRTIWFLDKEAAISINP